MIQRSVERLIVGAALAVTGSILLPVIKEVIKPVSGMGGKSFSDLRERGQYMMQIAREEVEDIVAEAQFERMRKKIDREIGGMQ
ncbi:DUF5132 domain-containing protein [Fodinisporobacter ferrooxydans]|uniref:DUF5132 domain-containing protein n=1 Tax=Fodinisporobacter ferrooxydans TaxID=2901836 RepID=A0ABY4CS09_9BACL|nr:DUF5132 domain-containing protein [Alicyclobacillaceae bacterium MYW30-H2]